MHKKQSKQEIQNYLKEFYKNTTFNLTSASYNPKTEENLSNISLKKKLKICNENEEEINNKDNLIEETEQRHINSCHENIKIYSENLDFPSIPDKFTEIEILQKNLSNNTKEGEEKTQKKKNSKYTKENQYFEEVKTLEEVLVSIKNSSEIQNLKKIKVIAGRVVPCTKKENNSAVSRSRMLKPHEEKYIQEFLSSDNIETFIGNSDNIGRLEENMFESDSRKNFKENNDIFQSIETVSIYPEKIENHLKKSIGEESQKFEKSSKFQKMISIKISNKLRYIGQFDTSTKKLEGIGKLKTEKGDIIYEGKKKLLLFLKGNSKTASTTEKENYTTIFKNVVSTGKTEIWILSESRQIYLNWKILN